MKKRIMTALILIFAIAIGAVPVLAEGTATLSGTVYLPDGVNAKDGDYIDILLLQTERSSSGRIIRHYSEIPEQSYYLKDNQTSVNYSINVPAGSYAVGVMTSVEGAYTWTQYYTSDGLTANELLAEPVSITGNKTVSMTIPAFERTVSGTITLDKPAPENGVISLAMSGADEFKLDGFHAEIPVTKGQKEAEYSISVLKGIYTLSVSNNPPFAVDYDYSVRGNFLYNADEKCYIDTREKSVTLDFELPADRFITHGSHSSSGGSSGTEGDYDEEKLTPVTVKMPAGISSDKRIDLIFTDIAEGNASSGYAFEVTVPAGNTSVTKKMELPDDDFYITVEKDLNGNFDKTYYVGGEYGITSDASKATLFKAGQQKLTLDLTNAFSVVSGTFSRGTVKEGEQIDLDLSVYVKNEQDDPEDDVYLGQSFGCGVYLEPNESSAPYAILVPRELSGEAELFMDYCFNDTIKEQKEQLILPANIIKDLTFPDIFHKVEGTVSLSSPAPKGGAAIQLYQSENSTLQYFIPEGGREIHYEYYALNNSGELAVECISDDTRYNQYCLMEIDNETVNADTEIVVNTKTISGTVSMKENEALSNAASYLVTVEAYDENGDMLDTFERHGTLFMNSGDGKYSLNLPDTTDATEVTLDIIADGGMELTVIPENTDFTLTSEVGITNITAEYDSENEQITVSYTPDGSADYTLQAVAAVYDKNGTLIYVQPEQLIFDREAPQTTFSAELNDKLNESTSMYLLIWKSFKNMKPVCNKVPVTAAYSDAVYGS